MSATLRSPRSVTKASPAAADEDEDDEIDAYLEWEEEVNAMSTSELKEALMVTKPLCSSLTLRQTVGRSTDLIVVVGP